MRAIALSIALLAGSALAASGCVEQPAGSGCIYLISGIDGSLVMSHGGSCADNYADQVSGIGVHEAPRRDEPFPFDPTTTTVAQPPAQTAPVTDPPAEPTGSVLETRPATTVSTTTTMPPIGTLPASSLPTITIAPATSSTTTTTTTTPPVQPLVASLSCVAAPLGILFAGTGNPGDQVTLTRSDPIEWYSAQPATPTVVAGDGSWQFTISAAAPTWFPATVHVSQSSGATVVVSIGTC